MPSLHRRALKPILALTAVFAVAACDDASEPLAPEAAPQSVLSAMRGVAAGTPASGMRIFTRNIFLGGDTGPLFSLDFPDPGNEPPQETIAKTLALLAGVNTFWGQVQATDFAQRAEAIADEIASTEPHVVALQEVARYAVVDLTSGQPVVVGGVDFLGTLQAELAGRGLSYDLVVVNPFVEGQLPLAINNSFQFISILDISVGEATLVRSDVKVLDSDQGNYQVGLDLGPLSLARGWSHVRLKHAGMPYHVVNTHLETQGIRPVHNAQASELIGSVLADLRGMTVLVGDLNSDALGPQNASNPAWTPTYGRLLDAGFADAWLQVADKQGDGATCCFDPDLANPDPSVLDERIDFVLVRRPGNGRAASAAAQSSVSWMTVLGDQDGDQTTGGLWPADHAGLYAELYFPGVAANK